MFALNEGLVMLAGQLLHALDRRIEDHKENILDLSNRAANTEGRYPVEEEAGCEIACLRRIVKRAADVGLRDSLDKALVRYLSCNSFPNEESLRLRIDHVTPIFEMGNRFLGGVYEDRECRASVEDEQVDGCGDNPAGVPSASA